MDWQRCRIGDICTVERGGSPRPIDQYITDDPDGINWIKIGDASDSMYITSTAQRIIPEGAKKSRFVKAGDFILSNSMSFGRPYILKIDGCIHDGWLVLHDDGNRFDKRFLYYYLSSPVVYQTFKSMAVGGVVNNLNSEMVRKLMVPVPEMEEQVRIAGVLDKISELISLRKKQLQKLDDLVKSRFVEMFDAGSPSKCKMYIHDYADVISGFAFSSEDFCENEIPIVRISNINNGKVSLDSSICFPRDFWESNRRYRVLQGDVLMAMSGATTGKAGINTYSGPLLLNQRVACIRAKQMVSTSEFLFVATQLPWMYNLIQEASAGCAQPNISGKQIENMPIPAADYEKQKEFSVFANQIENLKLTVQPGLDKLELLKQSLMQKFFG